MFRRTLLPLLLLVAAGTLAGCGQKGPLTRPDHKASHAPGSSAPAPAATAADVEPDDPDSID